MSHDRTVIVADCDHANIEAERQALADVCRDVRWLHCRTEDEVIVQCAEAEALLVQYAPLTRRVLAHLRQCRVIVRYGVGVDTVDLKAAAERDIVVSNVPDYGTQEVADHALALMLCLTRKIALANAQVKRGVWDFRETRPVFRLQGKTLGIIGGGRIGRAMARRCQALGMRILVHDPYAAPEGLPDFMASADLETLLQTSDVVSLHCPLTTDAPHSTAHLLDEARLRHMKPTAYLINTARGRIVDEAALARVLAEGRLAGAAFDVLAEEPAGADHPLFAHENFLCTPHMAWHSTESAQELKRKAAEEARRVLLGEAPHYRVN